MISYILQQVNYFKDLYLGKTDKGKKRSSKWPKVRVEHLKKHPVCELCGGSEKVEVHHLVPYSVAPKLELEKWNLFTLCESLKNGVNCHLWFGHAGRYVTFNSNCVEDVKEWKRKVKEARECKEEARALEARNEKEN